jgi:bifunctional non-homologous end joining protein LigD
MTLRDYHRKRDFRKTDEPKGSAPRRNSGATFVVQHHQASTDHDDFRLELDGVLKSWAVPRRVSRRVGVKRLAVETEDHPLEYAEFEGTIPAGEYGAGTVEIWDHGTWKADGDPHQGLRQGKLAFTLDGNRMKGRWALVRFHGRQSGDASKKQWLLIREPQRRDAEHD